jgi:phosphoglycolate phosphatase
MSRRLVLFDFDGTLADSLEWFAGAFDEVADRYGCRRLEPGDRERLSRLDTRAILSHLHIPPWKLPLIARHLRRLAARDIDRIRLFPGAPAMLAGLAASGMELAIVSSNAEVNVRRVLGPAAGHFRSLACGTALLGKAARIRGVLRRTGTEPADALLIGDEARDIAAAKATGIASAGVAWGYTEPAALRALSPTLFFERIEDVVAALRDGWGDRAP